MSICRQCMKNIVCSLTIAILFVHNVRVSGYNIETQKIGLQHGEPGSQFGYSVAFANEPGWTRKRRGEKVDKVLLVGAPNRTVDNIRGYGEVQSCQGPSKRDMICSTLHIRQISDGRSMCDKQGIPNASPCEEDQRLGSTIAVNRNFEQVMHLDDPVSMVTVCAPGWKNTYNEFSKPYQKYMIGMCLKLREELNTLDCFPFPGDKGYCWPFWPSGSFTFNEGRPVYAYAESGFAVDYTKNGYSEVIAAPGVEDWRGGYRAYQGRFMKTVNKKDHPTTQYYGYSLVTGRFQVRGANVLAGVPNFYDRNNGNLGKIELLRNGDKEETVIFGKKRKCSGIELERMSRVVRQVGSKFGATVAAVDITGDDYDEVFVGAPLYSGDHPDEGRVFVYTTTSGELCGPIGILSGAASVGSLKPLARLSRFGTSIASAGDLNNDNYKDVVIGAPYEDAGRGAVYIYQGIGQCNCKMEDKFSQRISGRDLDIGLRTFGWHIYGEDDVDHNEYPDLAVGAYASDSAVVLRSRPIATVDLAIHIQPDPIPLNGSTLGCSPDKERLCVEVSVSFGVSGKGLPPTLTLDFELQADTVYQQKERTSRLFFRKNGLSVMRKQLTLGSSIFEETFILDVKNRSNTVEPKDIWTIVRIEGRYHLVGSNDSDFAVLDPVLQHGKSNHIQSDVAFAIKCESLDVCTSDLKLSVNLYLLSGGRLDAVTSDTIIYLDASNELQMTVNVMNLFESSYGSNFTSSMGAALRRDVGLSDSRQGAVDATCKQLSGISSSSLNCTADSKLDKNQNFKVKAGFDISRARLMPEDRIENLQRFIEINVTADQANNDTNRRNNHFSIKLPVQLKYSIEISVDKETSDQVRFSADEQSTKMLRITHRYYITNEGPSIVPMTYVNITVPVSFKDEVYAKIKEVSQGCSVEGQEHLIGTTYVPETTEIPTTRSTINTPKPQRRRREPETEFVVIATRNETEVEDKKSNNQWKTSAMNISCLDGFDCVQITCLVKNLVKHDQEVINITLDVHEKSLAKTKSKQEIRYGTRAVVTDPFVWFGGKVVPWDKTPYGEKWTTFIIEPATVATEINIWIIIGSILGALLLLIIVVLVLWKVGFFKRKKHKTVKKWRQESLYKRRSRASSTKSQPPYNTIEN